MFTDEEKQCILDGAYDESYFCHLMYTRVITQKQKIALMNNNLQLSDLLNGRYTDKHEPLVALLFTQWNKAIGWKLFGF